MIVKMRKSTFFIDVFSNDRQQSSGAVGHRVLEWIASRDVFSELLDFLDHFLRVFQSRYEFMPDGDEIHS